MRTKRRLVELEKKNDLDILDGGSTMYAQLTEQYCELSEQKHIKRRNPLFAFCVSLCCVFIALSAVLPFIFVHNEIPKYAKNDEESSRILLDELYKDVPKLMSIDVDKFYVDPLRVIDKPTGDVLYYNLTFEAKDKFIFGNVYVVVNKYYEFDFQSKEFALTCDYRNTKINYSFDETSDDVLYCYTVTGCFTQESYKIYFSYEELTEENVTLPNALMFELFAN